MNDRSLVLAIDDEPKILELIKSYLEINNYTPLCAANCREGMALFEQYRDSSHPIDLILLDLMLPDGSGEDFCKTIRELSDVPIIMVTAKIDEASIIQGLNLGADDYIKKPFSPRELIARLEAILRRIHASDPGHIKGRFLSYEDLSVDTDIRQVSRDGKVLQLTRDEYHILALLMSRQAKIFTRDEILYAVKGFDYDGYDRAIDTHVKKLRAKIGDNPKAPRYITTVYGMGYRMGGGPES
ncbi:MAG: response regulator transcription factor [Treponema sp.]|nr:response regulator transcription factor [Treponema sp.]